MPFNINCEIESYDLDEALTHLEARKSVSNVLVKRRSNAVPMTPFSPSMLPVFQFELNSPSLPRQQSNTRLPTYDELPPTIPYDEPLDEPQPPAPQTVSQQAELPQNKQPAPQTKLPQNERLHRQLTEPTHDLETCQVCKRDIVENDPVYLRCGDVFCGPCIRKHFKSGKHTQRVCPHCGKRYTCVFSIGKTEFLLLADTAESKLRRRRVCW